MTFCVCRLCKKEGKEYGPLKFHHIFFDSKPTEHGFKSDFMRLTFHICDECFWDLCKAMSEQFQNYFADLRDEK